jgi:hypothetical protein
VLFSDDVDNNSLAIDADDGDTPCTFNTGGLGRRPRAARGQSA